MNILKDKRLLMYEGRRTLLAMLGAAIYAVGTNLFIVPSGLYSSGIMGLCQVVRTLLVEYSTISSIFRFLSSAIGKWVKNFF